MLYFQVVFLEHISTVYPHLLRELAVLDMAKLVTLMFDSLPNHTASSSDQHLYGLPYTAGLPENVVRAKLVCLRQTVNSQVFQDAESRALLLPTVCTHLKRHLVRFFFNTVGI